MRIKNIKIYQMDLALKEEFAISFKTYTHAHNFLIVLETDEGVTGYGEGCPDKPITGDSREDAINFLIMTKKTLLGRPLEIEEVHEIIEEQSRRSGLKSQTARAAIDMAVYDALGKIHSLPVYLMLGGVKNFFKVFNSLTIGIKTIDETIKTARRYYEKYKRFGLRRIKLKLSGDPEEDYKRVIQVAENFPGELTLDANQAYQDPETATKLFNQLYENLGKRIILVEQPTPKEDLNALKKVSENTLIPVFADESAVTLEDINRIISLSSAEGINIKLQKIGGILPALKAAERAFSQGFKIMVGCNEETHIAISAAIHLVAAMDGVVNTDLDSDIILFDFNITKENPLDTFINGARIPRNKPGLGVELANWFKNILEERIKIERVA